MAELIRNTSSERLHLARMMAEEDALQNAINSFNINPEIGINNLCSIKRLPMNPENIAYAISNTKGLLPSVIGSFLSKKSNENILFLYFIRINLSPSLTTAIHQAFVETLQLPSESEKIDHVLQVFSNAFNHLHPNAFKNPDTTYILSYALLMLNTDLHSNKSKNHMTLPQFLSNTRLAISDEELSDMELRNYYKEIQSNPILFEQNVDDSVALSAPRCKGILRKYNDSWLSHPRDRYFVLTGGCLYYYESESSSMHSEPRGMIKLPGTEITPEVDKCGFILSSSDEGELEYIKFSKKGPQAVRGVRRMFFEADNPKYLTKWMFRIRDEEKSCLKDPSQTMRSVSTMQFTQGKRRQLRPRSTSLM